MCESYFKLSRTSRLNCPTLTRKANDVDSHLSALLILCHFFYESHSNAMRAFVLYAAHNILIGREQS